MPIATIAGHRINHTVVGDFGPWLVLTTGGRRGHQEFAGLAVKIARHGYRVLLHDRRNTGASDLALEGGNTEEALWADDLLALLTHVGAVPAFIGGSSSGARLSILFALRYPQACRALLLFRVTGGAVAAERLPENYYGQFIRAAQQGGMAAVAATEHYRGCLAANPDNRVRLLGMDPADYIALMTGWKQSFDAGIHHDVLGVTDTELGSITVPTLVVPGNDGVHSSRSGQAAHRLIPGSELHRLPLEDQPVPLVPFEEWAPQEEEIAQVFASFMRRVGG